MNKSAGTIPLRQMQQIHKALVAAEAELHSGTSSLFLSHCHPNQQQRVIYALGTHKDSVSVSEEMEF